MGLLAIYVFAISIGLSSTIFGISSEILPNYLLAQATSLITTAGWLFNFAVNSVFLTVLDDENGRWYVFIILGSFCLFTIIFIAIFVPETIGKSVKDNLTELIGREALNRKRSQLRREYGIKDLDVASRSKAIKDGVNSKREPYRSIQQV